MQTYHRDLKSQTAGEGSYYSMKFASFAAVPASEQQKVLATHGKKHEERLSPRPAGLRLARRARSAASSSGWGRLIYWRRCAVGCPGPRRNSGRRAREVGGTAVGGVPTSRDGFRPGLRERPSLSSSDQGGSVIP